MALTKVSGPLLHGSNDNLGNYVINNITGAAATFSSVSVGGTLTYDDVTNVDSVGIVTARGGLHVGVGGTIIHALSEDNGKVGIGTDNPVTELDVTGDITIRNGAEHNAIRTTSDGKLQFLRNAASNNTVSVTIDDANGKVGVGSANPDSMLHLCTDNNANVTLKIEPGTTAGNYSEIVLGRTSSAPHRQTTPVVKGGVPISGVPGILFGSENTNLPAIAFQTPNSSNGHIVFKPKGSEKVRITADGDVGIGTVPARRLSIFDTDATVLELNSTNSGGTTLRIQNNHTDKMYMGLAADFIIGQSTNVTDSAIRSNSDLLFATGGGNEKVRIASDGKVGINTNDPQKLLELQHTTNRKLQFSYDDSIITIKGANNNANPETIRLIGDSIRFHTGTAGSGTERIRISGTNGSVGIGTDELQTNSSFYHTLNVAGDLTSQGSVVKIKQIKNALSNDTYTLFVNSSAHTSNVASAGPFGVDTYYGRAFTINGFGRVGIQTTRPSEELHLFANNSTILNESNNTDPALFIGDSPRTGAGQHLAELRGYWNGNHVARIVFAAGTDTTNKDDGHIVFSTSASGSSTTERLRIYNNGAVLIGADANEAGGEAKLAIDCEGMDIFDDVGDPTNYGLIFANDPTTNKANGIGFFNDSASTCGGYIVHQDRGGSNIGDLLFGTASTADTPVERLRITSKGNREIRNFHYGPWAFTNNTTKTTITVGDPGDNKFTTIKLILTLRDTSYRQALWQGEFTIFASNATGGPGVDYYLKKIWDHEGSSNWSGATVSVSITSGGALQFTADNSHDDANGNAYIHILDVIGDIDGSTVASISS